MITGFRHYLADQWVFDSEYLSVSQFYIISQIYTQLNVIILGLVTDIIA